MNLFYSSSLAILLLSSNDAFTFNSCRDFTFTNALVKKLRAKPLFLSEENEVSSSPTDEGATIVKSRLKQEIAYDSESGRLVKSSKEEEGCVEGDEYCVMDKQTGKYVRLTVEEKERIFLDALQSYYINGREILADDEFDLLKADLQWAGSSLVSLNRKEARFISATQAYLKGAPIITDEEFDSLKKELKEDGSQFAVDKEPKCYIDTGVCKSTFEADFFRTNLLYFPAAILISLAWLGVGYEVLGSFIKINPVLFLILGTYFIYNGTITITENYIFPNNKIAYGSCPSCEAQHRIYFGDILGVEGYKDVAPIKCKTCKKEFRVQSTTLRASTLPPK